MRKSEVRKYKQGTPEYVVKHAVWSRSRGKSPSATFLEERNPRKALMLSLGKIRQEEKRNSLEFLYPTSRQFPVDEVCEQIVRELEKRNWQVPGINVEFHEYGSGAQKFRAVLRIKSQDFKLWFCRVQRTMPGGRWNDTAGVTEIVIPKKELHVYEDESGPTFYLYVGDDYERDREKFVNGSKVNSKLNGEPKLYLEYKGGCDCRATGGASSEAVGFLTATLTGDAEKLARMTHTHSGRRPPLLVHTNDLGREYDPEGDEPKLFRIAEVMAEFKQYLEEVVLKMVVAHPIPTEKVDTFASPESIPFPESVGSLFCFGEYRDAERIKHGKENPEELDLSDRYGLTGSGYRLMSLETSNDGTVPEIAYDGFLWCGIGEVTAEMAIDSLEVPGHYWWSDRERFVIRLKPSRANGIYIADHAQYDKRRKELGDAMENGRDRFTDAEVADFTRARARTIIPISEYKGGYEQPVVLINRELSFDEVEVIKEVCEELKHAS
ncbi:MAG: hypothetical protein WC437_05370 [Patescibacteria group bacterium]